MSHWQKIREEVSRLRAEVCESLNLNAKDLTPAETIVSQAVEYLGLFHCPEHPDSANLRKALAVLEDDVIYFNNKLPKWFKNYCIAHEVGHFRLHHASTHCSESDIENFETDDESPTAASRVVGYGAHERREREANLFALEFLLPCDALRHEFIEKGLNAEMISPRVGLPVEMIYKQLSRAILTPPVATETKEKETNHFELDESQRAAAETDKCPVLIAAGPGTGKTQTLINRILFLLEKGTAPDRILALTFSNKATEEMRERIAAVRPDEAKRIPIMTFHSYGLDILRQFWVEAGQNADSNLVDKIDALLHLEKHLNHLNLEHYQNLHEPTQNLSAILAAISRAKDELVSPEKYLELAENMLAEAKTEEDRDSAAKAIETARVYDFYQKYLEEEKLLDFGDLLFRAVSLLQENEDVRQNIRAKYDAILVDEFQDVNRACGHLLREIAGEGKSLWAVGDLRQSIYRWRGASPANLQQFSEDFPNAETLSLENNYRSKPAIIKTFASFAKQMKAADERLFSDWQPARSRSEDDKSSVIFEIADSLEAEAENLAKNILRYRENGIFFKEQAIICRTHNQLSNFAASLSKKGIPIFYLGELFEREEIRDLLALLDLKHSSNGYSLIRVGAFAEYKIPLADVQVILSVLQKKETSFSEILTDKEIPEKLSEVGRPGWDALKNHLSINKNVSTWKFLCYHLFIESKFLHGFLSEQDVQNQQKLLAVYQFLQLAASLEGRFTSEGEAQIPAFLSYVKRLAWFGEDRNFSQIPGAAEHLDAVRLLTVHSAKGLEFKTVYLPFLAAGKIPSNRKGQICPTPKNMIEGETNFHEEEEACLFFVAMSRARDFLHLSRAASYSKGNSNSNESKFLTALQEILPLPRLVENTEAEPIDPKNSGPGSFPNQTFYSADLDRYLRCPRQFYYVNLLGLKARDDASIYLKFHSCLYDTIHSLQSIRHLENFEITEENALARLEEFWQAAEMNEHPYSPIYKQKAEQIIRRMCERIRQPGNEILRPTYEVKLGNGAVRVRPDSVEIVEIDGEKQAIVRRLRTGKSPKKVTADDVDTLMMQAVKDNFSDAKAAMQKVYLSDDVVQDVPISEKVINNRLKKYEDVIEAIYKKQFPADPSDDNCPNCAYFFICPSGE